VGVHKNTKMDKLKKNQNTEKINEQHDFFALSISIVLSKNPDETNAYVGVFHLMMGVISH